MPYAYETENTNFRKLLTQLNVLFGVDRIDAFKGSYTIPATVHISTVDRHRAEFSAKEVPAQAPSTHFAFELLTSDYRKVRWTLAGPVGKDENSYAAEGKMAVSDSEKTIYRLKGDQLEIVDTTTGLSHVVPLPADFPEFSWAMDISYDMKRKIVCVVTLGGEGFLYRFDAKQRRWMDYRSLNNVDIASLFYDAQADRYVAWTTDGSLVFISGEGAAMFTRNVMAGLQGFGRLYDSGNSRPPRLQVVAKKDDIALVYIGGNTVSRIWHYNVKTQNAVLTHTRN
ncbi:hypothetical protein [Chitinolyticbacter albus]|uniref:hypothetical protein n=1 Tax=Chitinolyticbacter albus TaxID=2961951 RepID=UPI00210CEBB1|nr:hypothetical protein [Chitinolyticbacter albus]